MKRILVLGASQSTPYLIDYLLELSDEHDWHVTVGDLDEDLARERVGAHPRGRGVRFDVNNETHRGVVVHFRRRVLGGPEAWAADETLRRAIEIQDGEILNEKILSYRQQ